MAEACVSKTSRRQLVRSRNASVGAGNRFLNECNCDGFRIDTLKHVSEEQGRNFCGSIKEFAENLGKADFFLVGEVAGSDDDARRYRDVLGRNLKNFAHG